jgi:hypothetical protein
LFDILFDILDDLVRLHANLHRLGEPLSSARGADADGEALDDCE